MKAFRLLLLWATVASLQAQSAPATCQLQTAKPAIEKWFHAWELTANEIMHIGAGPKFDLVFYDSKCVYTTSAVTGAGSAPTKGPSLLGREFQWRAKLHGGTITLPNGETTPVQLMSYASADQKSGPFFIMALPEYWIESGKPSDGATAFTGVFLHEFSHIRQVDGFDSIGPMEEKWKFKEPFDDDMVQKHFGANEEYVNAFHAERDLLYRAATAGSISETRSLAEEALKMIKARHARWFVGDEAVFAPLDSVWLSLEGSGQWTAYAWLQHPKGGGASRQEAIDKMLGRRKWWSQDEGLALFLVIDRLLPEWPSLVFHRPSMGAVELLERAVQSPKPNEVKKDLSESVIDQPHGDSAMDLSRRLIRLLLII